MHSRFGSLALRWAARLNGPRAVALAALLVAVPTLLSGFIFDDFFHILTLRGDGFGARPLDLFLFATGDREYMADLISGGPYPWFTWPELKLHFFRPLSSATMMLDYHLFGENAWLYHLHSVGWYALLTWAVFLVYRRLFALPVAGLCILLYILDVGHILPVLWWSNRNALVSAAPAVLGLVAHLRWREEGWRPGLPLSLLGYGLGLLGGETALGVMGYLAAYELLRKAPWLERVRCLLPAALLASAYLVVYKLGGHGVSGSGVYLDPIGEWRLFLAEAPRRMIDLVGTQLFRLPVELAMFLPGLALPLQACVVGGLMLFVLALRPLWNTFEPDVRHHLRWLLLGALLAAVPALSTYPSGRLLILPSLGAGAWIGVFLFHALAAAKKPLNFPTRSVARYLLAIHLLLAPVAWVGASVVLPVFTRLSEPAFREMELASDAAATQRVFCLYSADPYTGFYPVAMRRYLHLVEPLGWQVLSVAPFDHEVTRTSTNQFELRVVDGEMLATPFERLLRTDAYPLKTGEVVSCDGFSVTVLDAGSWGPRRIRLDFDGPLEDEQYVFLTWQGGRLARFEWPRVGERALLKMSEGYYAWKYFKQRVPVI
jgi:hypothetical protein